MPRPSGPGVSGALISSATRCSGRTWWTCSSARSLRRTNPPDLLTRSTDLGVGAMLFERFGVIDVDTHITEPPDTWLGRMPSKWGEAIPHIERVNGFDTWVINGQPYAKPGNTAMAGFDGTLPD